MAKTLKKKPAEATAIKKTTEKKKRKTGLIVGLVAGLVVLMGGGMVGIRLYFGRTVEMTETVEVSEDTRSFSGFFKEYLANRVAADNLLGYQFREMTNTEILSKLTELKDGFAKVSRGMNGFEEGSEFFEMAEVMKADATEYLTLVRALRAVETEEYAEESDRQVAFIKAVDEEKEKLRSRLYIARSAFADDPGGLTGKDIVMFKGVALVEVGGGVMNVFAGNTENNVVALTGADLASGAVKTIAAEKLYGYTNARIVKLGTGLKDELETGKLTTLEVELGTSEAKITRRKIGLMGKTVWKLDEVTERFGAEALVLRENKGASEILTETEAAVRGKKKTDEA
ncbi:hypothetical protein IJI17_01795 [Candidatus Saccharibacteria bacterium]|nr:hypothetical protein [Candidatus Saccharibacteria bacterium]